MKFLTLAGVAVRSLFLEAAWNSEGQQNLGLAAAIDPALKRIHPTGAALRSARERALDFFNTNPVLSGLAIGVILRLEEDVAAGRESPLERNRLSTNLNLALASMGDVLFWQSWLPFCALAAVLAVLSLDQWWAPLILPVLFSLPALPVRVGGLYLGYAQGVKIIDLLARLKVQRLAQRIRRIMALLTGVATVVLIPARAPHDFSLGRLWATIFLVTTGILIMRTAVRRVRLLNFWYPLLWVAGTAAVLLLWDACG
jgi:PTS system mannose-specific IID component